MGKPKKQSSAPLNVDAKLRGNDHRILLVKAAALGLISLISLSQLGTGAKLGSGGPKVLLPVTVTTVVAAAVMFGIAYRNMAFASAQLNARITAKLLTKDSDVPSDVKGRSDRGWAQAFVGLIWAGVAVIFYLLSVWWPAAASVPVDVYVGYADSLRATPTHFPTPWADSPGVTFEGCLPAAACVYDAGAIRIVNNTGGPVTVNSVAVHVSTCIYAGWPTMSLAPGGQVIVTQMRSGAANACTGPAPTTMDTSDIGAHGGRYVGDCTPDGILPTVDVTVDGTLTTYTDSGQVLNTGGVDRASCPSGTNESTQWTLVGHAPSAGSELTLAPPS